MQKWQVEHFENKVKRQFNPLIEDQELLIRQFRTEATNVAVDKLAKKWWWYAEESLSRTIIILR